MPVDLMELELDRIRNIVRPLGWIVIATQREEGKVTVTMVKEVKGEV